MNCPQLKLKFTKLQVLQEQFEHAFNCFMDMKNNTPAERGEVAVELNRLKIEIQDFVNTEFGLFLNYSFGETQNTLRYQYSEIKNILRNNSLIIPEEDVKPKSILQKLGLKKKNKENDEKKLYGIKNPFSGLVKEGVAEFFPFPTEEQIRAELTGEKKEFYELKIKQGFTRIQITPIIPLVQIYETLRDVTRKHDGDDYLVVDRSEPVRMFLDDSYNEKEYLETMIYFVDKYPEVNKYSKEECGGFSKKELLEQSLMTPFPGYMVELKQENPLIHGESQDVKIGDRLNLGVGKYSAYFLKEIKKKEYVGERLITVDSLFIEAINNFESGDGILHDWSKNLACLAPGTYCAQSDAVPFFGWENRNGQFELFNQSPFNSTKKGGTATFVRLG